MEPPTQRQGPGPTQKPGLGQELGVEAPTQGLGLGQELGVEATMKLRLWSRRGEGVGGWAAMGGVFARMG